MFYNIKKHERELIMEKSKYNINYDNEICFEKIFSLIQNNIITEEELKDVKNVTEYIEFSEMVRKRIIINFAEKGVMFYSFDGIIISPFTVIEKDTVILPGTIIYNNSFIGSKCTIGPDSYIDGGIIGNGCTVIKSVIHSSTLKKNVSIGPFSQVRPGSVIHNDVKIGDFVEIKNSIIGQGTHASHLTYIGDSDIGSKVNFGCGTVISNYNGYKKFRSTIGDNAFIGCNTNIISPVNIGDGAYTAAGSTITQDVPDNSLGIAREKQVNKIGWAEEFKKKNS